MRAPYDSSPSPLIVARKLSASCLVLEQCTVRLQMLFAFGIAGVLVKML